MLFTETELQGAFIIDLQPHADDRGFFAREFCRHEFEERGLESVVAQANLGFNIKAGTLRGMHFQYPPAAEAKLVRCVRGAIFDTIVDLRPESPTYLKHISVELNEDNWRALYIPKRFAHGYQTLKDNTVTSYNVSAFYAPSTEGGLRYDDPALGLEWPLPISTISQKDRAFRSYTSLEHELRHRMRVQPAVAA